MTPLPCAQTGAPRDNHKEVPIAHPSIPTGNENELNNPVEVSGNDLTAPGQETAPPRAEPTSGTIEEWVRSHQDSLAVAIAKGASSCILCTAGGKIGPLRLEGRDGKGRRRFKCKECGASTGIIAIATQMATSWQSITGLHEEMTTVPCPPVTSTRRDQLPIGSKRPKTQEASLPSTASEEEVEGLFPALPQGSEKNNELKFFFGNQATKCNCTSLQSAVTEMQKQILELKHEIRNLQKKGDEVIMTQQKTPTTLKTTATITTKPLFSEIAQRNNPKGGEWTMVNKKTKNHTPTHNNLARPFPTLRECESLKPNNNNNKGTAADPTKAERKRKGRTPLSKEELLEVAKGRTIARQQGLEIALIEAPQVKYVTDLRNLIEAVGITSNCIRNAILTQKGWETLIFAEEVEKVDHKLREMEATVTIRKASPPEQLDNEHLNELIKGYEGRLATSKGNAKDSKSKIPEGMHITRKAAERRLTSLRAERTLRKVLNETSTTDKGATGTTPMEIESTNDQTSTTLTLEVTTKTTMETKNPSPTITVDEDLV